MKAVIGTMIAKPTAKTVYVRSKLSVRYSSWYSGQVQELSSSLQMWSLAKLHGAELAKRIIE